MQNTAPTPRRPILRRSPLTLLCSLPLSSSGIPKFYRWLSERYPLVNQPVLGTHVPEVDNLYLVRREG